MATVHGVAKSQTRLSDFTFTIVRTEDAERDSSGGPGTKTLLLIQGAQVQTQIRELRSHMPQLTAPLPYIKKKKKIPCAAAKTEHSQINKTSF